MKHLPLFALLLVSAPAMMAAGQTSAAPKPAAPAAQKPAAVPFPIAKVAVVAFQAAVTQTNEFQRDIADLQKKYDPRRVQLKSLSDEIDTLTKQLQADDAKLSDAERASRARAIDEKKKKLDRDTQDAQSDFQTDMQQIINNVAEKVGVLMSDYADKHGYTLVLDEGDQQTQTVLYAVPPTMDITKEIIDAYNTKSGIPAPAPQAVSQPDAPQPQH
ncbi:MAG: OmpH family outer membrane protein [Terracidiphilus sp.]|jgi:outer membrane protein